MRWCYGNDTAMLLCSFLIFDIYDDAYSSKNACFTYYFWGELPLTPNLVQKIYEATNSTKHDLRPLKYAIPADTACQHPWSKTCSCFFWGEPQAVTSKLRCFSRFEAQLVGNKSSNLVAWLTWRYEWYDAISRLLNHRQSTKKWKVSTQITLSSFPSAFGSLTPMLQLQDSTPCFLWK